MHQFVEFPNSNRATALPSGAPVLGIGVTLPEHVSLCTLGNIGGRSPFLRLRDDCTIGPPESWSGRACIDIATEIPMPPDHTVLATTRATIDTVGAMAVLVLRSLRLPHLEPRGSTAPMVGFILRVQRVARRLTYQQPAEWSPRSLPTPERPWPEEPHSVEEDPELAHVAAIGSDAMLPLAERVAITACWLLWGDPHDGFASYGPSLDIEQIYAACGVPATGPKWPLMAARMRVDVSRRALVADAPNDEKPAGT